MAAEAVEATRERADALSIAVVKIDFFDFIILEVGMFELVLEFRVN